jgi:PIN domain nuclease of toxin-antitoxin system
MKLLLDTHLLLWAAQGVEHLPMDARTVMGEPENELFFSVASLCEIVIKCGLGREDFKVDPRLLRRGLLDNGYSELPILSEHAVAISALPPIHKDPFDRLLVAQAIIEGITLLTADIQVAKYSGPVKLV